MRRFSQRNSLVTLNEINITPLLDLAFVLLIIFVITRPLLEQSINLKLPDVGKTNSRQQLGPLDIRTIEITPQGKFRLGGVQMYLPELERTLVAAYRQNPKLVVFIRADRQAAWDNVANIFNICIRNGITRVSPQTAPVK